MTGRQPEPSHCVSADAELPEQPEDEDLMSGQARRQRRRERQPRVADRANARIHAPQHLVGASDWANDPNILSTDWLLGTLRAQAWACQPVIDTAQAMLTEKWGPARKDGNWITAYLCFVISRIPDIQPWLKVATSDAFWRELGFEGKPPYNTVRDNFIALEKKGGADVFEMGGNRLVRQARSRDKRIGMHASVDGCEAETHGSFIHDCQPGEGCPYETGEQQRPTRRTGRGGRGRHHQRQRGGAGTRPQREHSDVAKKTRQDENEQPPAEAEARRHAGIDEVQETPDGRIRVRSGGHWYRQTDPDAGRRMYEGPRGAKRFWEGYYDHASEDNFCGGTLAIKVNSASRQEWHIYPELLASTIEAIGDTPEAVMGDKGLSVEPVFRLNSELGIASIFPWRPKNGHDYGGDTPWFDRHGIPRCGHCGAEGIFVRFAAEPYPRLWFVCSRGTTESCRGENGTNREQTISCSKDWRTLLPLWRNDPLYHQLKESHDTHERGHHLRRTRFLVGGDNCSSRPKRMGIGWQNLRAQAARFIEWLAICDWNGWFPDGHAVAPSELRASGSHGRRAYRGLMRSRAVTGIDRPYGEEAARVFRKWRWRLPPSERGSPTASRSPG